MDPDLAFAVWSQERQRRIEDVLDRALAPTTGALAGMLLIPSLLVLLLTARLWLPWLRGSGRRKADAAPKVLEEQVELPVVLPLGPRGLLGVG